MEHNVVGEHGSYRMLLSQKWMLEAHKRGLRDPWQHDPHRILETKEVTTEIMGKPIKSTQVIYRDYTEEEMTAWKAERDEYMRQRDEWTALQMFHKFGYEVFLNECKFHNSIREDFWKTVFPCESRSESQCTLFCPIYKDCALRLSDARAQEGDGKVNAY